MMKSKTTESPKSLTESSFRVAAVVFAFCATTALLENAAVIAPRELNQVTLIKHIQEDRAISPNFEGLSALGTSKFDALADLCPTLHTRGDNLQIQAAVVEAAYRYDLSPELLYSVMAVESRCRKEVTSPAGAMGLMQLMPATARSLGVSQPYSIRDNVLGGAKYLAYLLDFFNGNLELAIAGYNAGPYRVRHFQGIPPFPETQKYVRRVLQYYQQFRLESGKTERA